MPSIKKAVEFMIRIAGDNTHGYSQDKRNGPDYDCSSLVSTALHEAGFNVDPTSYTGNLNQRLLNAGFEYCTKPFKAGDIHLAVGHHVCINISDSQIAEARINELGKVTGGKTGDQTGREIWLRTYYDYPWTYHYRYNGVDDYDKQTANLSLDAIAKEVISGRWGTGYERKRRLQAAGYNYSEVQNYVNLLMYEKVKKSNEEIAREVVKGLWGNGDNRKKSLAKCGYDYEQIQRIVNQIYSGSTQCQT